MLAGAAALLVATGGLVIASGGKDAATAAQEAPASTATVQRGKLWAMVSVDGTLTYRARSDGSPYSAINQASGTYTELPDAGDKVGCGDVFYRVDEDPVLLLCGAVPAYRDLEEGDDGPDVQQLNRNLQDLGYDADAGVDIDPDDREFTWETEAALEKLQDDKGFSQSGQLDVDDAVFLPTPARISAVRSELGGSAQPGVEVAQATSDTLEVQVNLDASQQGAVKRNDRAQITLPGNELSKGKVDRLGKVAQSAGKDTEAAAATLPAYIGLNDPKQASGLDRAPVQVDITTKGVKDALSVPVTAIVGRPGGFAVEVVGDDGQRELVAVEPGLFDTSAGRVEVEGDLAEGDRVVVPSA
jgi:peptidoglycan hydrolase-like protein with peptidoglycan-binding domain